MDVAVNLWPLMGIATIVAKQLPCSFGSSLEVPYATIEAVKPERVIAVGQAGGRADISIERVAINIDDARIPDNAGAQPVDQPVVVGGPVALFSTLPVNARVAGIREAGIPASVSQTAGTCTCNHVMYGLMHYLRRRKTRGGFIHLPYLPEQAMNHPGAPGMPLATNVLALEMAVSIAPAVEEDIRLEGGATH